MKKSVLSVFRQLMFAAILAVSLILSSSSTQPVQASQQSGDLARLMAQAQSKPVRVLVTLRTSFVPEGLLQAASSVSQRNAIKAIQNRIQTSLQGKNAAIIAKYDVFPMLAMKVDAAALSVLSTLPDVASIQEDKLLRAVDLTSNNVIGAPAAWSMGYDGTGWAVVVLDTGIQKSHPFLAGKVVAEACFSTTDSSQGSVTVCPNGQSTNGTTPGQTGSGSGVNCPLADCSHGTHVGGIIAGKNYSGGPGYDGVARGANLISIQVFSKFTTTSACGGTAPCVLSYTSDELGALQYVYTTLRTSFNIASINMSLGGGLYTSPCDSEPLKPAIDNLRSVQIATVIAAGNDGSTNSISSPGCISSAISVGATNNSDAVASFSNRASFMSVYAPGVSINSSVPTNSYAAYSGTSMATPHVAGAWAVVRQKVPGASVSQILAAFRNTGAPITNSGFTIPRIKVDAALNSFTTATNTPTRTPTTVIPTNTGVPPTATRTSVPPTPTGTNLALNKPATSSASCNTNEVASKAVNGSVSGGNSDKWCDNTSASKWLRVDLGANYSITQFIIRHAGAGGESTAWNTNAFNIQLSTDNVNWTTVVTVSGNTASVTTHNITAATGRYARLNVTNAGGDGVARIYEFEVYGSGTVPTATPIIPTNTPIPNTNLALNKPTTANGQCASTETSAQGVDGTTATKWCGFLSGGSAWLQVDLGGNNVYSVSQFVIQHAGTGGETTSYNTRDFKIQGSSDAALWSDLVTVTGNTASTTTHNIAKVGFRYFRLWVTVPEQSVFSNAARIYEFQIMGYKNP